MLVCMQSDGVHQSSVLKLPLRVQPRPCIQRQPPHGPRQRCCDGKPRNPIQARSTRRWVRKGDLTVPRAVTVVQFERSAMLSSIYHSVGCPTVGGPNLARASKRIQSTPDISPSDPNGSIQILLCPIDRLCTFVRCKVVSCVVSMLATLNRRSPSRGARFHSPPLPRVRQGGRRTAGRGGVEVETDVSLNMRPQWCRTV